MSRMSLAVVALGAALAGAPLSPAQNWDAVPLIEHQTFQAVDVNGATAYSGAFPIRLRGVILNNPEDWLDPTANYNEEPFNLGGQWEIFVQAADPNDSGGTSAWMGQCYGNLPFLGDPIFNYTDAAWEAELARLNFPPSAGATPIRAGDLIEVRARAGLPFDGKMNVNEQHSLSPSKDFDVVLLQRGYGLPAAAQLTLSDFKDAADVAIFDPNRQTGGERYQSSRVTIRGVRLASAVGWGPDTNPDLALRDQTGRTLRLHLGRNPSFAAANAPSGSFSVTGFINQESVTGRDGYYLIVTNAADFRCGDANCDGVTDFADIDPFVLALSNSGAYRVAYPGCFPDMNGDDVVDFADIDPFVAALSRGGGCP